MSLPTLLNSTRIVPINSGPCPTSLAPKFKFFLNFSWVRKKGCPLKSPKTDGKADDFEKGVR